MVRTIAFCICVVFFATLFLACSSNNVKKSEDWPSNARETKLPSDYGNVGFFQNPEHIYGFDRHPEAKNGADLVAYVSTLKGEDAIVTARVSNELDYDYFICNQNKEPVENIDRFQSDYRYVISTGDTKDEDSIKVALCRERKSKIQKLQELQVYPYEWKSYDFDVYIFGHPDSTSARHQLLNRDSIIFWNTFDSTFKQAVVKHVDNIAVKFVSADTVKIRDYPSSQEYSFIKDYILTRGEGTYVNDMKDPDCHSEDISDIGRLKKKIESKGGPKRAIVQVGYKTRRFWPLELKGNNIDICGAKDSILKFNLEVEPVSKPDASCPAVTKASVYKSGNIWMLRYKDGTEAIASKENLNINCAVFAEADLGDYVGEVNGAAAIAWSYWSSDITRSISVAIGPWLKDPAWTTRVLIHELGHTMGLADLDDREIISESKRGGEESNLMHAISYSPKEFKLRKRDISPYYKEKYKNKSGKEYQWDCLQNKNYTFCLSPTSDPHYDGPISQ